MPLVAAQGPTLPGPGHKLWAGTLVSFLSPPAHTRFLSVLSLLSSGVPAVAKITVTLGVTWLTCTLVSVCGSAQGALAQGAPGHCLFWPCRGCAHGHCALPVGVLRLRPQEPATPSILHGSFRGYLL